FNTADFDCSRSGSFRTCLGVRFRFVLLFAIGTVSIRRGKKLDPDRNLGLSHPGAFTGTDLEKPQFCGDKPTRRVLRAVGNSRDSSVGISMNAGQLLETNLWTFEGSCRESIQIMLRDGANDGFWVPEAAQPGSSGSVLWPKAKKIARRTLGV